MAFQIKKVEKFNIGTIRKPVYRVYDKSWFTDFNLSDASYSVKHSKTGTEIADGPCAIDNAGQDVVGNTIKTVQPTLNFTGTDVEAGPHFLSLFVEFTNGESDVFLVPIEIVEYREA